jgi:hypothetical protein
MSLVSFFENNMLTCSIKGLTGLECPGCGMQRALVSLLRGNLSESIMHHPALIPLIFTIAFTALHLCFNFKNGARHIVVFYCISVSLMIVNFVGKSFLHL